MQRSYPPFAVYSRRPRRIGPPRVLVVAPHPDDDVIGCGGILQRLAARGGRCCVVYVTDGSASHVKSKRFPPPVLRDVRENEARAALAELGVGSAMVFLRAPDSRLAVLDERERGALVARLARVIDGHRTQLLFAPWLRDPHPDHVATARLVQAALASLIRRPELFMYGVWLPVRGTAADEPDAMTAGRALEVRLTAREVERKRAAILAHRSQAGDLIDDDPEGFHIDEALLARWLTPIERLYRVAHPKDGYKQR